MGRLLLTRQLAMKAGVLAISLALHGAAFAATFGHATSTKIGDITQTLEIEAPPLTEIPVEMPVPEVPTPKEEAPKPIERSETIATHTHDYPVAPSHDATPHDPNLVHAPVALDHDADHKDHNPNETPEPAPAAAPEVLAVAAPAAPRFTMNLGSAITSTGGMTGGGNARGTGLGDGETGGNGHGSFGADEPAAENAVDEPARVTSAPAPRYPSAALEEGIEANVPVEIVVDATGVVRSARATGHVGYGLDQAAVDGVRAYRFSPAKRAGHATAVRMKWVVRFQLR